MKYREFENLEVAAVFDNSPPKIRKCMMDLRQLIFDTAASITEVGEIEETLKWGQPSYLTSESKSGSMIRIDKLKNDTEKYALFFLCQTSLIETFKERFGNKLVYKGNRAIHFDVNDKIPVNDIRKCFSMALTYKLDRKRK